MKVDVLNCDIQSRVRMSKRISVVIFSLLICLVTGTVLADPAEDGQWEPLIEGVPGASGALLVAAHEQDSSFPG